MRPVDDIPEDELGVEMDACNERRIQINDALWTLRRSRVDIESAADGLEIPQRVVDEMREMDRDIRRLIKILEDEKEALDERGAELRHRLDELD